MSTHKKEVRIHHSKIKQAMSDHLRGILPAVSPRGSKKQGDTEVNSAAYKDLLRQVKFSNKE